jgi:nucleoside-diphosphate-sugar epimerase
VAFAGTHNRYPIDKARRELGYEPRVDLDEAVRLTARWYLETTDRGAPLPSAALSSPEGAVA